VEELIPVGDDVVIAHVWHTGWVPGREDRVKESWAMVWTLRDGGVRMVRFFSDRDEARAAAGT
jgi:ketosteroid isomerase-like protein